MDLRSTTGDEVGGRTLARVHTETVILFLDLTDT
jgi:hypothetical protein